MYIIIPMLPYSADTAVVPIISSFRSLRHTAEAILPALRTGSLLAYNLCSIVLPRLFLN